MKSSQLFLILTLFLLFIGNNFAGEDSFKLAQSVMDPAYQNKLVWIKVSGPVEKVNDRIYYFFDPSTPNNIKVVGILNGRINKVQPGEFKGKASESYIFNPELNKVNESIALQKVADYAKKNQIDYDRVAMELRRFSTNISPTWKAVIYRGSKKVALLGLNDIDGEVVSTENPKESSSGAKGFFQDVEKTFKGIGGDLEEFFTNERTVDQ